MPKEKKIFRFQCELSNGPSHDIYDYTNDNDDGFFIQQFPKHKHILSSITLFIISIKLLLCVWCQN